MSTTAGEANASTKRVRTTEKAVASRLPGGGPGFGKNKPPRAFLKDKQAEILEAYGLETLPGQ